MLRLLLVDDSRTMRNIQKNVLKALGEQQIVEAGDGYEALTGVAEAKAHAALAALGETKAALQACLSTRICVASLLHPGVIIRFPIAEALVTAPHRGPLEIALCTKGGETHIVAIDRCRNTTLPLQSLPCSDGRADIAHKLLAGPVAAH